MYQEETGCPFSMVVRKKKRVPEGFTSISAHWYSRQMTNAGNPPDEWSEMLFRELGHDSLFYIFF